VTAIARLRAVVVGIEWNLVGRAKVQCDVCGGQFRTGRHKFLRAGERAELAGDLRDAGWVVDGDHERHVCPECVAQGWAFG
jgi:hypothetical protein